MFLLIDTSEKDNIVLALFNKDNIEYKNYSVPNRELLVCIDELFISQSCLTTGKKSIKSKIHKVNLNDLEGIMVVVGAGNFTNTRIACVVANTFAYILQIPLLAIQKEQVVDVQNLIPKLLTQIPGQYISATYSAEPNIGKKK